MDIRVCVHGRLIGDIVRRRRSCDVLEDWYDLYCGKKQLGGEGTHLDCATLPGENGRLAFVVEEIVFTISKLCAEDFSVPFQDLKVFSIDRHSCNRS